MRLSVAGTIFLLSPIAVVKEPPPLPASPTAIRSPSETRFRGHPTSREVVRVGIAPDGTPLRVTVTHRLELFGTGDYFFVVPAPATSVRPGPGTQSQPGLRDVGVVWQGFSDRHKVLSATVGLQAAQAARGLPLRVSVERRGGSTVVRLENVTRKSISVLLGRTSRTAVVRVLGQLRAAYGRAPVVANLWQVDGEPGNNVPIRVTTPLRVRGTIAAGGRSVAVDRRLGGAGPNAAVFTLPTAAPSKLRLRVDLLHPLELLPTTDELAAAPQPLLTLQRALGEVAVSWAYRRYLAPPDPVAPSSATYAYRTVARPVAVAASVTHADGGNTLAIVLAATLGAAALVGLAVLWARS
jgi:hypothetical protein